MHNVLLSVYDVSLFQVQPATFALLKLAQARPPMRSPSYWGEPERAPSGRQLFLSK